MKAILIISAFLLCFFFRQAPAFAQLGIDHTRDSLINEVVAGLDQVSKFSNLLAALVDSQVSEEPVSVAGYQPDMDSVKKVFNLSKIQQKEVVKYKLPGYDQQVDNLQLQYGLMYTKVSQLFGQRDQQVYSAQIDYVENLVSNFIATTNNFKLYLHNLIPVPADDLLEKIERRIDESGAQTRDSISKLDAKSDLIIRMLRPRMEGTGLLSVNAYSHSLLALSYLQALGVAGGGAMNYLGAKVLVPVSSQVYSDPGVFVLYGIRYSRFFAVAGVGELKNKSQQENVSWNGSVIFCPANTGIGLDYSPVTGIGLSLSFKW